MGCAVLLCCVVFDFDNSHLALCRVDCEHREPKEPEAPPGQTKTLGSPNSLKTLVAPFKQGD